MSNNLVNQSTKAISTNELRSIGPVLAVMSSGLMDLFLAHNIMSVASLCNHDFLSSSSLASASSSSSLSSVSTPPDHMLGQIRFILCMHMQLYPV